LDTWPSKIYFKPMPTIFKSYDIAFKWVRNIKHYKKLPKYLDDHGSLISLFNYFKSDEVSKMITDLSDDGIERSFYSFILTWAKPGSALIPHMDGIADKPGGNSFINILYFVSGKGALEDCGATSIFKENNYNKILFRPTSIINSALIYKSDITYHGFPPMKPNTYRFTINIQFCSKDY